MKSDGFYEKPSLGDSFLGDSFPGDAGSREQGDAAREIQLHCSMNRRAFVVGTGTLAGSAVIMNPLEHFRPHVVAEQTRAGVEANVPLSLRINGQARTVHIDPRVTLLDLLREHLDLTGTKKGCDHGQCGACTVLANGRRVNSCLSLAVVHDGEDITTIEGLANGGELHPLQTAFLEHDGFQCGYCTPGQICSAVALLREHDRGDASFVTAELQVAGPQELTATEIRERMSGNICRCGAYPGIVAAVEAVRDQKRRSNG